MDNLCLATRCVSQRGFDEIINKTQTFFGSRIISSLRMLSLWRCTLGICLILLGPVRILRFVLPCGIPGTATGSPKTDREG